MSFIFSMEAEKHCYIQSYGYFELATVYKTPENKTGWGDHRRKKKLYIFEKKMHIFYFCPWITKSFLLLAAVFASY